MYNTYDQIGPPSPANRALLQWFLWICLDKNHSGSLTNKLSITAGMLTIIRGWMGLCWLLRIVMILLDQVEDCESERDQTCVGLWIMRRWRLMFEILFGLIIGKIKLTWACVWVWLLVVIKIHMLIRVTIFFVDNGDTDQFEDSRIKKDQTLVGSFWSLWLLS